MSTFANACMLNSLVAETVQLLVDEGVSSLTWMSGNAPGWYEANARFFDRFTESIKKP